MKANDRPVVVGFIEPATLKRRMKHSRRVRKSTPLTVSFGNALKKAMKHA